MLHKTLTDLYANHILQNICNAGIAIYKLIENGSAEGSTLQRNNSGDIVQNLDLLASAEFISALTTENVHSIVGEESDKPIIINKRGNYRVAFDPLDGSSNIGLNSSLGSVFTIFKNDSPSGFMRKGDEQILSGYFLYGPFLELIICLEDKIYSFVYDRKQYKFIEKEKNLICPAEGKYYSVNYCNKNKWSEHIGEINYSFVHSNKFTFRYSGTLIADFHRILIKGGVFAYHADKENPDGKLRLLYECFPLAKIIEAAGGCAINDFGQRILDLTLTSIHEKSSIIIGSSELVKEYAKNR